MHNDFSPYDYDLKKLLPELFLIVPEIESEYNHMKKQSEKVIHPPEYIQKMSDLRQSLGMPSWHDYSSPGMTIVFENLLVPQIVALAEDAQSHRLEEIFIWIETLANSEYFAVRNLVGLCVCIPLMTSRNKTFPNIFPYMGNETIEKCRKASPDYRLDKTILELIFPSLDSD